MKEPPYGGTRRKPVAFGLSRHDGGEAGRLSASGDGEVGLGLTELHRGLLAGDGLHEAGLVGGDAAGATHVVELLGAVDPVADGVADAEEPVDEHENPLVW